MTILASWATVTQHILTPVESLLTPTHFSLKNTSASQSNLRKLNLPPAFPTPSPLDALTPYRIHQARLRRLMRLAHRLRQPWKFSATALSQRAKAAKRTPRPFPPRNPLLIGFHLSSSGSPAVLEARGGGGGGMLAAPLQRDQPG